MRRRRAALLAALAAFGGIAGAVPPAAAQSPGDAVWLTVVLGDGTRRGFTRAALEAMPAESAPAKRRDGSSFTVTGVSVTALLKASGLDLSQNLGGGQVVSQALVARAADGYRAVFGLAEADPHFGHAPLIVNWKNDDGTLLPERSGPVQLFATGDGRSGRWVRQLISLEVKPLP